jgi:hypothetical protein
MNNFQIFKKAILLIVLIILLLQIAIFISFFFVIKSPHMISSDLNITFSQNSKSENYITLIITNLITIFGFIVLMLNVKKEIKASEVNLKQELSFKRKEKLQEFISDLLVLLSSTERGELRTGGFINEKHIKLEKGILIMLDPNNADENSFREIIIKYKTGIDGPGIENWIKDIELSATNLFIAK